MEKLLVTYALLGYLKETSLSKAPIIELYVGLNIPIPILSKIMEFIRDEIGDDKVFALYNDGAFIIKSMVFDGIGDILQIEKIISDC